MTNGTPPTERHRDHGSDLITPVEREQVLRVKQQLDQFTGGLRDLFHKLHDIDDAIFRAQQAAVCLLADDVFGAWDQARKREQGEDYEWNEDDEIGPCERD